MSAAHHRARRGGHPEAGYVTVWTAVVVMGCVLMLGLVVDGGTVLRARADAFSLAGAAARVGALEIDPIAAAQGQVVLDTNRARAAAQAFLAARSAAGTVDVNTDAVTVIVHTTARLRLLVFAEPAVAIDATATVDAVKGTTP